MSKKILALVSCILIVLCFSACKGEKITLGAYQPIDPASLSDEVGYNVTEGDFTFDFKENGKFSAYLSFGNSIAGDYEVNGKKIICRGPIRKETFWKHGQKANREYRNFSCPCHQEKLFYSQQQANSAVYHQPDAVSNSRRSSAVRNKSRMIPWLSIKA